MVWTKKAAVDWLSGRHGTQCASDIVAVDSANINTKGFMVMVGSSDDLDMLYVHLRKNPLLRIGQPVALLSSRKRKLKTQ